jgi:hypothetical protein
MKPQIGGVVALWVLLSWHPRRFLVALAVPFVLTMFYAEHVGTTAMTVLHEYAGNLQSVYGHAIPFTGHTDLRAWIVARWPSAPPGLWLSMLLALALVSPALVAVAVRRRPLDRSLELLAFCGVVSLLAVRHLSYDLLLVLPALAAWRTIPFSAKSPASGAMGSMFVILCAWLLLDPSAIARRVLPRMEAPDALTTVLLQADRILCVVLWGVLSVRLFARHETRERQTRASA